MRYNNLDDLPSGVKDTLPEHAQLIYMKAFNHAWEEYATAEDRIATASRVAWGAVEREYKKHNGTWIKK